MTWFSCMTRWQFPFSRYNNSIDGHSQTFCSWQDYDKILRNLFLTRLIWSLQSHWILSWGLKTSMIFTSVLNLRLQFVIPCLIYLSLLHWNLKIPEGGFDAKKEEMAVEEYGEVKRNFWPHHPTQLIMHLQVFPISVSITNVTWVALFLLFHYTTEWWSPLSIMLGKVSHVRDHLAHPAGLAWCLTQHNNGQGLHHSMTLRSAATIDSMVLRKIGVDQHTHFGH